MATGTRRAKTAEELKEDLAKAEARVARLRERAYEGELTERINASKIIEEFKAIQTEFKDVSALTILSCIGKAAKIPRLNVTQSQPVPRKSSNNKKKK